MKIKDSEQNSWLKKRAEMYATLAESDYSDLKKVEFHFDDPEAGWVDMTVKFDGKTVAELPLTNAWGTDPMRGLLDLMEANIDSCEIPHYFFHDGERVVYIFHFEDIVFPGAGYRHANGYFYSKGIFSLYIHPTSYAGEDELNFVVCDSTNFIANLYTAIRDFAKRQEANERAVKEWAEDAYWGYWTAMMKKRRLLEQIDEAEEIKQIRAVMQKSLRSTKIERFLKEREIKK
jgi:predicted transcriptional regulator